MTQPSPTPVPSLTVAPHGPPSVAPSQPAGSPGASTGMPDMGGDANKLPTTGPDAGVFVVAGVLAVLAGSALARRARTRRGG